MSSTMKRILPAGLAAFTFAMAACAKDDPAIADATLYKRIGGYDALAVVTDSFLARIQRDTAISVFFAGLEPPQLNRIRQMVVDQLCAASGGPCLYVGRTMKETHATLDITNEVFDKFVGHFKATLIALSVPQREQDEVLGALGSMKADVVTR
jgi:hemoglobin